MKHGNGTLTLAAANLYGGATTVNAGVLALGDGLTAVTDTYGTLGGAGSLRISAAAAITSGNMSVGTYALYGTHTLAGGSGTSKVLVSFGGWQAASERSRAMETNAKLACFRIFMALSPFDPDVCAATIDEVN